MLLTLCREQSLQTSAYSKPTVTNRVLWILVDSDLSIPVDVGALCDRLIFVQDGGICGKAYHLLVS